MGPAREDPVDPAAPEGGEGLAERLGAGRAGREVGPGRTALTRAPPGASSFASPTVRVSIAPFEPA